MSALLWFCAGVAVLGAVLWLKHRFASFAAQSPGNYADTRPVLDLRTHLSGRIKCHGVIYGPLGRVASRFDGDFTGHWDGDTGTLAERFTYDSGTVQDREWRLSLGQGGSLTAQAGDVVGTGRGQLSGATLVLRYRIRLPAAAGGYVLRVTDWMYLAPGGIIVNRSQFRMYGLKVAELVATMKRMDAP